MANQFKAFISVLKALEEYNVNYILIGGVALIFHGMERLTRDIDLFIKKTPENIENLKKALKSIYRDDSIDEITLSELKNYPVIRYGTPNGFCIDIIANLGEAVSFEDLKYEIVECQEIKIKIAKPETLYNLKKDTLRNKDNMDVLFLREIIGNKKDERT